MSPYLLAIGSSAGGIFALQMPMPARSRFAARSFIAIRWRKKDSDRQNFRYMGMSP
jgi:hypothetical protein